VNRRRLALVVACMLLAQFAVTVTRPMTSYRLLELGNSAADVGWVSVLYALVPLVLFLPASGWAAGRGIVLMGLGSCALVVVGCAGLAVGEGMLSLTVANVLLGAGASGQMLTYQSVIARESGGRLYDRDYGWMAVGVSLGQLIGPVAATFTFEYYGGGLLGTTASMSIAVAAGVAGLALTAPLLRNPLAHGRSTEDRPPKIQRRLHSTLSRPGAKASMYVSLVVTSAIDLWTVYMPVLGEERGWTPSLVGLLLALRAAASLLARVALSASLVHVTRRQILTASVSLAAITVSLVPFLGSAGVLMVAVSLLGLGLGIGQPVTLAWSVSVVRPEEQSTSIAIRLMGNRVGQVVLPALAALVVGLGGGAAVVFWLLGSLLASSAGAAVKGHNA
jgi:MFS family permease